MVERELLPVTRRISGGRAILHGDDLIVTVAARCEEIGLPNTGSVRMIEIYHRLAEVFLFAFEELGIEAELGNSTPIASQSSLGDCFALTTGVDIQERSTGNKLLGAALFRRGDMFLEQVSVPLRSPEHHEAQIALGDRVFFGGSGLGEVACGFSRSSLMSRILGAIQNVLAVTVVEMGFTSEEHSSAIRYRRLRYNSTDWIRKGVFSSQITD
jgi:lipoate-protein ligase A